MKLVFAMLTGGLLIFLVALPLIFSGHPLGILAGIVVFLIGASINKAIMRI